MTDTTLYRIDTRYNGVFQVKPRGIKTNIDMSESSSKPLFSIAESPLSDKTDLDAVDSASTNVTKKSRRSRKRYGRREPR